MTFVEVRNDRRASRFEVEDGITSGDYLQGFLRGTRSALYEKGRESITMSIPEVNAFYIGALIAVVNGKLPPGDPRIKIAAGEEAADDRFSVQNSSN